MQKTQKTACSKCEGKVEFPVELKGQTIPCPHCGASVILGSGSHDGEARGTQQPSTIPTQTEQGRYIPYAEHKRKQNQHVFLKILGVIFVGLPVLGLLGFSGYWMIKGTINLFPRLWKWGIDSAVVVASEVLPFLVEWSPWLFFAAALLVVVRVARKQTGPITGSAGSPPPPALKRALSRESAFFGAFAIFAFNKAWEAHRVLEQLTLSSRRDDVSIHASNQLFWLLVSVVFILLLIWSVIPESLQSQPVATKP